MNSAAIRSRISIAKNQYLSPSKFAETAHELFDEKTVRAWGFGISSNVEQGGMEALNSIAQEARTMLVDYYGDCERIYKDGLFLLYNKHKAAPTETVYVNKNSGVAAPAAK